MNQQFAVGKKVRIPWGRINEELARSLPRTRSIQDTEKYRQDTLALSRENLANNKAFAEDRLRQQEKDAKKARKIAEAGVYANLGLGLAGAGVNAFSGDEVSDSIAPAVDTEPVSDALPSLIDSTASLWDNNSTYEPASDSLTDFVDSTTSMWDTGDFIKKWWEEDGAANDLYSDTFGDLFSFDTNDFDFDFSF